MLLTAFIGPTVGRRIDRVGGRGVLTASSLVFACGLALLGAAPNLAVFALGWGVIGLGMGMGLYEAAFATLTASYGRNVRNAITAIPLLAGFASTACSSEERRVGTEWVSACSFPWGSLHYKKKRKKNRRSMNA